MTRIRTQRGAVSSTLMIAIVVAIVIALVLFFVLRDQGKDDKPNKPAMNAPQIVSLG